MAMRNVEDLPERAQLLGQRLRRLVLPSTSQLRAGTGLSEHQSKRGLRDLKKEKLVASAELGCLLPGVDRLRFTESGLSYFEVSDVERSWQGNDALGNLIRYDLPKLEALNSLAPRYATEGWTLWRINWFERQPLFAVAEYRHPDRHAPAYLPWCWSSFMDTQRELVERLEALPETMQTHSVYPNKRFFPAGLAIVGADEWAVARALSMACEVLSWWLSPHNITGWFYGDDWHLSTALSARTGMPPQEIPSLLEPMDSLRPAMSVRMLGKQRLEGVLNRCPWAGRLGRTLFALLTKLGEFPVEAMSHYKSFVGESPDGTETEKRMAKLMALGLAEVVTPNVRVTVDRLPRDVPATVSARGQGGHRYALTQAGRVAFCYAHGGRPADLASRTKMGRLRAMVKGVETDIWPYRHEDGAYETLAQFCEMGCIMAPGWRARVTLADGKRIDPDGLVLVQTPWGKVWSFLEFELSDRSYKDVEPRVEKYASEHRRDAHPLLVVCHDDRAEKNFHAAGLNCDRLPRMLTTTLVRMREAGVAGTGVWSYYGLPHTLAS